MRRFFFPALFLIATGSGLPAIAQAIAPGEEGPLLQLAPAEDGARACFRRVYDRQHLVDHPRQQVTEIDFRVAYHVGEPEEYHPAGQRNYFFELGVKRRAGRNRLVAAGECSPMDGGGIFCGVECDGGGVAIHPRGGNPQKILVDLQALGRIRMTMGCDGGEEHAVELTPGEDDKAFLLSRLGDSDCPVFEDW